MRLNCRMSNLLKYAFYVATAVAIYAIFVSYSKPRKVKKSVETSFNFAGDDRLIKHGLKFDTERIVEVTDGVYVAIGFAIANVIMVEGRDGIVIIDTTEHQDTAVKIFKEFRKITTKPLRGIVMTHFHPDHVMGAAAIMRECKLYDTAVNIYMHKTSGYELQRFIKSAEVNFRRGMRQFGNLIKGAKGVINAGIGPRLHATETFDYELLKPTHTFDKILDVQLAGLTFQLIHTPGETDDQITVWFPDKRVIMPADNIYEAFPNLYAIRGSPPRSSMQWVNSLDIVRNLRAEHMVPSHTRPMSGEKDIFATITAYRDAIQFVNDQTIRLLNKHYTGVEISEKVKLPPSLFSHPYLQEHYGTVAWSVRNVYDSLLGWFDGKPSNLYPLLPVERAERMISVLNKKFPGDFSGHDKMIVSAKKSLKLFQDRLENTGDALPKELQWALEISTMALEAAKEGTQEHEHAKEINLEAMRGLASISVSANARNYYLTCAQELETGITIDMTPYSRRTTVNGMLSDEIMALIVYKLNSDVCDDEITSTTVIEFTDESKEYWYILRHCIFEYHVNPATPLSAIDVKLMTTGVIWKSIATQERNALAAYATGDITIEGSVFAFKNFIGLLDQDLKFQ